MQQNEMIIVIIIIKTSVLVSLFPAKICIYTGMLEFAEGVMGNGAQVIGKLNMNSSLKTCKRIVFVV